MNDSESVLTSLAKPATVLIERISDAIGGAFRPFQIRRVAKAESDAALTRAMTEIQIGELHQRSLRRFVMEEGRKQVNMEAIAERALPSLTEGAKPEAIEDDWIVDFFDKCRLISDAEMQTLWARILSGQANAPGSFSKRTLSVLASLDKADAQAFTKLCGFSFVIAGSPTPFVYSHSDALYKNVGVDFAVLTELDSLGLIRFDGLTGFIRRGFGQKGLVHYFDQEVLIEFPRPSDNELKVGHVMLTKAGEELLPVCSAEPQEGFVAYVVDRWRTMGIKAELPEKA